MIQKKTSKEEKDCKIEPKEIYDFYSHIPSDVASLMNSKRRKAFFLSVRVERIVNNQSTNREK
jgi:hypothetical protein